MYFVIRENFRVYYLPHWAQNNNNNNNTQLLPCTELNRE